MARVDTVDGVLAVRGLTKRYGAVTALDDVTFEVDRGQIVGFLGPNGAGKTTTMRAIMQLVALDAGSVVWEGEPVNDAIRQRFGYMPAERGMYPRMTVRDHLVYYGRLSGLDEAVAGRISDTWLERLGLGDRVLDPIQSLSSGNQQRVQLALALLDEPELLVLDEPFSGLDPVAVDMLTAVLFEQLDRGAAVLLSSHQLDLVAGVCTDVVIVDRGHVVLRGDVDELRAASPTRFLHVHFAAPTTWDPGPGAVTVASSDGRRHRVEVPAGTRPDALLASAATAGEVVSHRFGPPDLSEVFRQVVGRPVTDDTDGSTDGAVTS